MTEQPTPFFLTVADHDQGFFCVEGPMPIIGPGSMPRAMLATNLAGASCAAQPSQIETHSPLNFSVAEKLAGGRGTS